MSSLMLPPGTVCGQKIEFSMVHGEVVGVERLTDTHFETTPGSAVVFGNVVSVTAPSITTHSQASKCVWVRKEDGTELSIPAPDGFQARPGHSVTALVASGSLGGVPKHQWCVLVNYNTGRWNQLDRFPPANIYDGWTNIWMMGMQQGGPATLMFLIVVLWVAIWLMRWGLFGTNDMLAFITNFWMAGIIGIASVLVGKGESKSAEKDYAAAVRRAADAAFEVGYPPQASVSVKSASGEPF